MADAPPPSGCASCTACGGRGVRARLGATGADTRIAGSGAEIDGAPVLRCGACVGRGVTGDGAVDLPDLSRRLVGSGAGGDGARTWSLMAPPPAETDAGGGDGGTGAGGDDASSLDMLYGGAAATGAHVVAGAPQHADFAAANRANRDRLIEGTHDAQNRQAKYFLHQAATNSRWYDAFNPVKLVQEIDARAKLALNQASAKGGPIDRFNRGSRVFAAAAGGNPAAGHDFNGRAVAPGALGRSGVAAGLQGARALGDLVTGGGGDGSDGIDDAVDGAAAVDAAITDLLDDEALLLSGGSGGGAVWSGADADLLVPPPSPETAPPPPPPPAEEGTGSGATVDDDAAAAGMDVALEGGGWRDWLGSKNAKIAGAVLGTVGTAALGAAAAHHAVKNSAAIDAKTGRPTAVALRAQTVARARAARTPGPNSSLAAAWERSGNGGGGGGGDDGETTDAAGVPVPGMDVLVDVTAAGAAQRRGGARLGDALGALARRVAERSEARRGFVRDQVLDSSSATRRAARYGAPALALLGGPAGVAAAGAYTLADQAQQRYENDEAALKGAGGGGGGGGGGTDDGSDDDDADCDYGGDEPAVLFGGAWYNSKGARIAGAVLGTVGTAAAAGAVAHAAAKHQHQQQQDAFPGGKFPRPNKADSRYTPAHETLGVTPGASAATVNKRYHEAARRTHSDKTRTRDDEAFKRVAGAVEQLRERGAGIIDGVHTATATSARRVTHKRGEGRYAVHGGGGGAAAPPSKHSPAQLWTADAMPTHRVDVVPLGEDAKKKEAAARRGGAGSSGGGQQQSLAAAPPLPAQHLGSAVSGGGAAAGHVAWRGEAPGHLFATLDPRTGHPVAVAAAPDGGPPRQLDLDPDGGADPLDGHAAAVARSMRVGGRGGRDDALLPKALTDVQAMQAYSGSGDGGGGGGGDEEPEQAMAPRGYPAAWAPGGGRQYQYTGGQQWPSEEGVPPGGVGAKRKRVGWHADHPMRRRAEVVRGVMTGRGVSWTDASRIVKEEGMQW